MQERRVRLGDTLDDYCPRERRITNHVAVAIVDGDVKQTRCTTCDAEHVYKHARVPAARRKKAMDPPGPSLDPPAEVQPSHGDEAFPVDVMDEAAEVGTREVVEVDVEALFARVEAEADEPAASGGADEDWPVHRRLIRATLPRPEGQAPERKAPDFFHHSAGHPDRQRGGQRHRDQRRGQHAQGQGFRQGGGQHSGNARRRDGQVDGNRAQGQPGNRSGHGRRSRRGGR